MNNFNVHSQYLTQVFEDFAMQQYVSEIQDEEKNEIEFSSPSFLDIDQIWQDMQGSLNKNHFHAIAFIGTQGTGKTSASAEFAKRAKAGGYRLINAMPEDYLDNLDAWLDLVIKDATAFTCLVLDDQSYAQGTKSAKIQAAWKNVVARFRKILGGTVFVIFVTHRLHATPPMMRNAGTWFFTEVNANDVEDMLEVVGKNKTNREAVTQIQEFLGELIIEGKKNTNIEFEYEGKYYKFRWGDENDAGDGRLMACLHEQKIQIFNAKVQKPILDLEQYRLIPKVEEN